MFDWEILRKISSKWLLFNTAWLSSRFQYEKRKIFEKFKFLKFNFFKWFIKFFKLLKNILTDVLELNETFKTVDEQLNAIHQNLSNLFRNENATVKLLGC